MTTRTLTTERHRCRLFGPFALEGPDGAAVRIRSRRARALIAFLVLAGPRGASRERLSGLLWSDRGEEQARASLRQCLLELKKLLGEAGADVLDAGRERIVLKADRLSADVIDLQSAIRDQDGDAFTRLLQAIGADQLLEEFSFGGVFDEWLQQTRGQLEHALEAEVRRLIDVAEAAGAWEGLRTLAEAALLRSPTDETVAAAAMRADMALGSTSAAHRRFRALERKLTAEYGVRPSQIVTQALTAGAAAPAPPRPRAAAPTQTQLAQPLVIVAAFEGAGADEGALAQTIRDEVVSGLSRFRDLSVVADQSPLANLDPGAFADPSFVFALGARIRPGPRPGLTLQLMRLATQNVVWSETFETPESGILSATDAIVGRVVGAILPSIDQDLARPYRDQDSDSSYLRYLHAQRLALGAASFAEAARAAAELEALVGEHPNFVLPYLPLAGLLNTDFNYTQVGSSDAAQALELAKKAMSIDRRHVHSYTVAGWCYLRLHHWDAAGQLFDQALSLNPFNASRLKEIGFGLMFLDRWDEARELLTRCLLINPMPDDHYFTDLGLLELACGAHDRAATYFELVANPSIWCSVYQAVNAQLSGRANGKLPRRARDRIASIWAADRPISDDAMIDWIMLHTPFRPGPIGERFAEGARAMLAAASAPPSPAPPARS